MSDYLVLSVWSSYFVRRNYLHNWVAVKELNLSDSIGESLLIAIYIYIYMYTHYGSLVPGKKTLANGPRKPRSPGV